MDTTYIGLMKSIFHQKKPNILEQEFFILEKRIQALIDILENDDDYIFRLKRGILSNTLSQLTKIDEMVKLSSR